MVKIKDIQDITLTGLQIKNKLETALSYDHKKYKDLIIPLEEKEDPYERLPFSDFKVSIAQELLDHEALQENLNKLLTFKYQELEYRRKEKEYQEYLKDSRPIKETKAEEIYIMEEEEIVEEVIVEEVIVEEVIVEEVIEEVIEEVKVVEPKKKVVRKSSILVVDTLAIIEKIKQASIEKNKGKKVIGRREINKMLDPFGLKARMRKDIGPTGDNDEILTSIDIYLNAVDKISSTINKKVDSQKRPEKIGNTQELSINEILKDLKDED